MCLYMMSVPEYNRYWTELNLTYIEVHFGVYASILNYNQE